VRVGADGEEPLEATELRPSKIDAQLLSIEEFRATKRRAKLG
jgi:hypothetical protein